MIMDYFEYKEEIKDIEEAYNIYYFYEMGSSNVFLKT